MLALSVLATGCAVVPAEPMPVSAGVYVNAPPAVVVAPRPVYAYPSYGYYGYGYRHHRHW
jgi:hypothetical protein